MACQGCNGRRAAIGRAIADPRTAQSEIQFIIKSTREDAGRMLRKWSKNDQSNKHKR